MLFIINIRATNDNIILKIIDAHSVKHTYTCGAPDTIHIDNVNKLKEDIEKHYEQYMKEINE